MASRTCLGSGACGGRGAGGGGGVAVQGRGRAVGAGCARLDGLACGLVRAPRNEAATRAQAPQGQRHDAAALHRSASSARPPFPPPPPILCRSYYAVVPLSLLPPSWLAALPQLQWPAGGAAACRSGARDAFASAAARLADGGPRVLVAAAAVRARDPRAGAQYACACAAQLASHEAAGGRPRAQRRLSHRQQPADVAPTTPPDPPAPRRHGQGSAVFLAGNALQCAAHAALAALGGARRGGKAAYRIPKGARHALRRAVAALSGRTPSWVPLLPAPASRAPPTPPVATPHRSCPPAVSPCAAAGPLFEWVSCPHYLAEIIIYMGLTLAANGSANTLLMLLWVVSARADGPGGGGRRGDEVSLRQLGRRHGRRQARGLPASRRCTTRLICRRHAARPLCILKRHCLPGAGLAVPPPQSVNLALAARATQDWYQSHFKTYPPQRRALVPFLY